eukprot:5148568-Pyramimonas_sp.AAC.1
MHVLRSAQPEPGLRVLDEIADQLSYIDIASYAVNSDVKKLPGHKRVGPDKPSPLRWGNRSPTRAFQGGDDGPI